MTPQTPEVEPNQEEAAYKNPRWLKVLVIAMGVAIIAMIGIIVMKIVSDAMAEGRAGDAKPTQQDREISAPQEMGDYLSQIDAPKGADFVDMDSDGGEVVLRFKHRDGGWTLVFFNAHLGVERGRLKIE